MVGRRYDQQLQGLHLQLSPQLQPWEVSPDSAAASNSAAAAFSGATPRTTVACAAVLFSSTSGYFLLRRSTDDGHQKKIDYLYYSIKSVQAAEFRLSHRSLLPAQATCDGFFVMNSNGFSVNSNKQVNSGEKEICVVLKRKNRTVP